MESSILGLFMKLIISILIFGGWIWGTFADRSSGEKSWWDWWTIVVALFFLYIIWNDSWNL